MNRITSQRSAYWVMTIVFLFSTAACSATPTGAEIDKSLEAIYLAHFGLEYPSRIDILTHCKQVQDKACLRTYQQVQDAKQYLAGAIKKDEAAVLAHVTRNITNDCPNADNNKDQQVGIRCYGAVISLYFFTTPGADKKLQELLTHSPKSVVHALLRTQFEWFYNRPHVDQWIALITALPKERLSDNEKQPVLQYFKTPQSTVEKFGVML